MKKFTLVASLFGTVLFTALAIAGVPRPIRLSELKPTLARVRVQQSDLRKIRVATQIAGTITVVGGDWGAGGLTCKDFSVMAMDPKLTTPAASGGISIPYHEVITQQSVNDSTALKDGARCKYNLVVPVDTEFFPAAFCTESKCPQAQSGGNLTDKTLKLGSGTIESVDFTVKAENL